MPCENYKAALISAVTNDDLSPALRAHAAVCASCTAELAQQRSLIAAIDSGVRHAMNAPLPPALLQRFEARFAQQEPPRSLNLSWLYVTTALATAAAVILFALPHLRARKSNLHTAALAQTAQSGSSHPPETMTAILPPASPEEIRRDRKQHFRTAARPQPEVLVPPDERIAFEHFLSDLNERKDLAAAIGKPMQEQRENSVVPLKTPDIETAALTVQPLTEATDR